MKLIPPLRDRQEDIPVLIDYFVEKNARELEHKITDISTKTITLMCQYPFSEGNVRELDNALYHAIGNAMLENDPTLRAGYLPESIRKFQNSEVSKDTITTTMPLEPTFTNRNDLLSEARDRDMNENAPVELQILRKHDFQVNLAAEELGLNIGGKALNHRLRGYCYQAIHQHNGDLDQAALLLAGNSSQPSTLAMLKRKIRSHQQKIRVKIDTNQEHVLFKNLPAEFRASLNALINQLR